MRAAWILLVVSSANLGSCGTENVRFSVGSVQRVVVFPFDNLSGSPNDADRRVTNIFSSRFYSRTGIEVVGQGELLNFITKERIRGADEVDKDVVRMLYSNFDAQLIILGTVTEFGFLPGGQAPVVGVSIRLVDPRSGMLLWAGSRSREGSYYAGIFDFGYVRSLAELTEVVVDEVLSEIALSSNEIAEMIETGVRTPLVRTDKPTEPRVDGGRTEGEDEEREDVRRAVRRYWQRIKETYDQ